MEAMRERQVKSRPVAPGPSACPSVPSQNLPTALDPIARPIQIGPVVRPNPLQTSPVSRARPANTKVQYPVVYPSIDRRPVGRDSIKYPIVDTSPVLIHPALNWPSTQQLQQQTAGGVVQDAPPLVSSRRRLSWASTRVLLLGTLMLLLLSGCLIMITQSISYTTSLGGRVLERADIRQLDRMRTRQKGEEKREECKCTHSKCLCFEEQGRCFILMERMDVVGQDDRELFPLDLLEKIKVIQKGGSGEIWLAKAACEEDDDAKYVLKKLIHNDREEWDREVYFGKLLRDEPYMARFEGGSQKEDGLWIAFRHEGTSLYSLFKENKWGTMQTTDWWREARSNNRVKEIMQDVFHALTILKAKGIVHRDIKPENIVINERNELRIIDFGSAIDSHSLQHLYRQNPPCRDQETATYSPPESWITNERKEDAFSFDVWSAGMVFLELHMGSLQCLQPGAREAAILRIKSAKLDTATQTMVLRIQGLLNVCSDYRTNPEFDHITAKLPFKRVSCELPDFEERMKSFDELLSGLSKDQLHFVTRVLSFNPAARITATEAFDMLMK